MIEGSEGLIGFLGLSLATASTGGIFRPGQWYETLAKPWWRPPSWAFGPAWAVLFVCIAVSGWLVWKAPGATTLALGVFGLQLVLNAAWSPIFFGLRRPDWAFAEILLLWLSIAACIALFHPIDARAAWLLVPYLAWVSFAATLNFAMWQLNRERIR